MLWLEFVLFSLLFVERSFSLFLNICILNRLAKLLDEIDFLFLGAFQVRNCSLHFSYQLFENCIQIVFCCMRMKRSHRIKTLWLHTTMELIQVFVHLPLL